MNCMNRYKSHAVSSTPPQTSPASSPAAHNSAVAAPKGVSTATVDAAIKARRAEAAALYPDKKAVKEIGGPEGPEPTRYGDWEVGGRCSDF